MERVRSGSRKWGRTRSSTRAKHASGLLEEEDYSPERSVEDEILSDNASDNNNEVAITSSASGIIPVDSIISPTSSAGGDDDYFVTSPPKRSGLTGNISTLFRRVASRERPRVPRSASETEDDSDVVILSDGDNEGGGEEDILSAPEAEEDEIVGILSSTSSGIVPRVTSPGRDGAVPEETELFSSDAPSATSREDDTSAAQSQALKFGRGGARTRSTTSKRIYASYTDDDSDDSYESQPRSPTSRSEVLSRATTRDTRESEYYDTESYAEDDPRRKLKRYRGFSTSIASLFLDESLVCTSIGCFGLILSNRTEHLLQVRDHIRGVKTSKKNQTSDKRSPSKVFSYLLLLTIVLIFLTFVIWGFGNGNAVAEDLGLGNDDAEVQNYQTDDAVQNQNYQNYGQDDYYKLDDDDAAAKNYNYNNDDGGQNNDDGQNNGDDQAANNDDAVAQGDDNAANDDANANYNDDAQQADDAAQQGDDAVANDDAAAADDAAADDAAADDGAAAAYDDYYVANDDDSRRQLEKAPNNLANPRCHRTTGIFKLRDYQEHLWDPAIDFAKEQWTRETTATRLLADAYEDDFTSDEQTAYERDLATDVRTALFLTFLLFLGVLGRRRRMRTRFQLVRARAQDDRLLQISSSGRRHMSMKDELEDKAYEVACSHTILGCYPVDPPEEIYEEEELEVTEEGSVTTRKKVHKHEDFVSRGYSCLMAACCGWCCKCWFQCLSVCALAQEAREMRLLLPPRYQRIDYITHQPFSDYQKDVNELRRGWMGKKRKKGGFVPHYNALSRLSRYILCTAAAVLTIILATLLFNPRAAFSWPDAVLLISTFVQSFLVLYIVHWIFHKSDLSLDAVIKFFAAGFVIAVPSAVFFEGVLVNIILVSAWTVYEICQSLIGEGFAEWMASNYRWVWVLGELFNAYIVAAVTEELCKYYTFRSVEHPDLIFLTGLDRKSHDEHTVEGGLVAYPFGAHNVSDLNRSKSFDTQKSGEDKRSKILPSAHTLEEFYEDENDVRTYRQKAAAVTTGMISVAVGLACAENMMYVFLLGGAKGTSSSNAEHRGDVYEEWIVLLFRSIFPIHALAAALQSINMVRKFVEGSNHNNHRIGVGRIILPAVILHGTFDAILMGINVYIESAWDAYLEENEGNIGEGEPYNPTTVNFAAWSAICITTLIGFLWWLQEHRSQQARLTVLEEKEKEEPTYISPGINAPKKSKSGQRRKV